MEYIKLIRVHQWIKNIFVFLPIFFAGKINDPKLIFESFIGFVLFSLVASSIYIINDYVDIEKDRLHPTKKNRPLASGKISKRNALIFLVLLIAITGFLCYKFGNTKAILICVIYFLLNLAYSFKLKNVAILDICIIAIGFLLRVFLGGAMTGLYISEWAILLIFFLALIMGTGKRRGELINAELTGKTRKALDGYNLPFTDLAMTLISACAIMCYIMYTLAPTTQESFHPYIVYTSIFVVIGVLRYLQQTFVFNKTESPTKVVYKDHFLQVVIILWIASIAFMKYQLHK